MRASRILNFRALAIVALALVSIAASSGDAAAQPPPPDAWGLEQNDPNPFCPEVDGTTSIEFKAPEPALVILVVLSPDSTTVIKTLFDALVEPGFFKVTWDGTDDANVPVAPGDYPYRMTAESSGEATILFEDTKVATIACPSAVEAISWGAVKALHAKALP